MLCACSVWMVPEYVVAKFARIFAPIDFSPSSADALTQATALAAQVNSSECMAVHVYTDEAVVRYEEHETIKHDEEAAKFTDFMRIVDIHGVPVKSLFVESINTPNKILEEADNYQANLIVISTRGHSRAAGILLGSVTSMVMAEAKMPVLVVKHYGAQLSLFQSLLSGSYFERSEAKTN